MLDMQNSLLQDIKSTLEAIIYRHDKSLDTLTMTNEWRQEILTALVSYSGKIPHPASGCADTTESCSGTMIRWQILAYVAGLDLSIAKWFESHLDALSILHEIGYDKPTTGLWAVWASEGHPDPIRYELNRVSGSKSWCSGANIVDYGLMTYRDDKGHSQLLIVDMRQNGIKIDNSEWQAVGMHDTDTATIKFDQVTASRVGVANIYLERVGFWHGAAGVAACWYGAAVSLATYLIQAQQNKPNHYKAMYLGEISTSLAITRQYFCHVANLIDTQSHLSHELAIRQLRANVEQVARQTIEIVGQAMGAAPFCHNAHFARLSADLAVFIRQSHGAFDHQRIGELTSEIALELSNRQEPLWQL